MANRNDHEEYFFDDADIEHLGSAEPSSSEGVVYDHDTETVESDGVSEQADTSSSESGDDYEEPHPIWLVCRDKATEWVTENKRMAVLIGGVVVVLVVAHFLGLGSHHSLDKHKSTSAQAAVPAIASKSKLNAFTNQPSFGQEANVGVSSKAERSLSDRLTDQSNSIAALSRRIELLRGQVLAGAGVSRTTGSAPDARVSVLQQQVQQLSKQVASLQAQLKQHASPTRHHAPMKDTGSKHYVTYHVRAIEPGRAWLEGSDESSLSVSKESTLPGYGRVTAINDLAGTVHTESGHVIRFSSD